MAGRPKRTAMIGALEVRTRDYFEDEVDSPLKTTLDYVSAWIAAGRTLKELAFALGQDLGMEIGRERLSAYLSDAFGAAVVSETLADARVHASHSMVDEALELVDADAETTVDVARAASRARQRNWTAERYNAPAYGQQKGVSVHISTGSLHLDALRATARIVTSAPELPDTPPIRVIDNSDDAA